MSLPWYYNSPVWRRYQAARLMYFGGGLAEGLGRPFSLLLAVVEMCSPRPRIKINIGKKGRNDHRRDSR